MKVALSEYTLTVQNVQLQLYVSGSGIPTLLLHGNPDSAAMWQGVIDALTPQCSCFAPDLPGFGRSIAPADFDFSLENMAEFIEALIQSCGMPTPLNLIVHDFGGPFGLSWAILHPHKVRRLAIFNSFFFPDFRWHFWGKVWRTPLLGELSMLLMNRALFAREMRRGSPNLSQSYIESAYNMITPSMKQQVLRLYRSADPEKFKGWENELIELTRMIPTAVFWGVEDPFIPVEFADRFGTDRVYKYADAGHLLPLTGVQRFRKTLQDFLL